MSFRLQVRLAIAGVVAISAAAFVVARLIGPLSDRVDPIVEGYCVGCHNTTDWDGGIAFEITEGEVGLMLRNADESEIAAWEKAARKVRAGLMPPAQAPRPARAVLEAFAADVEARLDRASSLRSKPGAEPLSRLNRAEYENAIRDLLAFEAGPIVDLLPVDEAVAGFDNIGEGLSVSPTLIESYVSAAIRIAREAVGDRSAIPTQIRYEVPARLSQDAHIDGLPLGTRGGFVVSHNFPLDATYEFRIAAIGRAAIASQQLCALPEITVAVNGRVLELDDPGQFRMAVPAGPLQIAVALLDTSRCAGVNELHDVYAASGGIRHIEIHGPYDASGPGDTPSRRAIFSCYPESRTTEDACARAILSRLATRAYRRPLDAHAQEIDTLLEFYARGREQRGFEGGIEQALSRILMSPQFIFQLEHEPAELTAGEVYAISDLELASRLSFFLWSSIPDEALLELASRGRLSDPNELEAQVERMLDDPRAHALIDNFAGQWLSLRELREALPQDPSFDVNLRDALERETSLLFTRLVEENRSVLDLLDSDTTFLNERLARHYDIAGVRGSHMREVTLGADHPRRGLIGHGSWLTATSVADRTSPVIRGEWFLTHLLGAPVPEPPPGVEADLSDEADIARDGDTLRERLERHRGNPNCASCHQIMDPIGLALENFDLIGRWRESDNGKPIDASAQLSDGTEIAGPQALRAALLERSDLFVTALTEKLLTYALGRVVEAADMPAVRSIVRDAARDDYRFAAIVAGIVASDPFRMRIKTADPSVLTAARDE